MIEQIDLRHFKCFQRLRLPLRSLTLLSGINASGKSSVMHAVAMLHQTMREHEWSLRLMLNGASVRTGTVSDVVDQNYGRNQFSIAVFDGDESYHWEFRGERSEMSMAVRSVRGRSEDGQDWKWPDDADGPLRFLLPQSVNGDTLTDRMRGLTYLTAERVGPRDLYSHDDPQLTPVVGPKGEYAVSILHSSRDRPLTFSSQSGLLVEDVPRTLLRQVEARMTRFFPGCTLDIQPVPRAGVLGLGIRISRDTEFLRPINTGFGLTQTLPIVVAALSASPNQLLLIENPEAHLHPSGQAEMGVFLARVAAAGIQVMIETHSDHVLNGIRRAVKSEVLPGRDVVLHFFQPRDEAGGVDVPQVYSPCNRSSW